MRTRLLVSAVAVAVVVFLAASSAFATVPPPSISVATPTNSPTITWGDVGSETGYRVYRADGDCGGTPVFSQVGSDLAANTLGFTDATLATDGTADGTYCYSVRSFDTDGESADSNLATVVFETLAPSTPGTPTGATPTASAPSITFTPSTDASGIAHYDVYRDTVKVNVSPISAGGPSPGPTSPGSRRPRCRRRGPTPTSFAPWTGPGTSRTRLRTSSCTT